MAKRKAAIIITAIISVLLIFALVFVLDFAATTKITDLDGHIYYIRKKDGVYALYDTDKKTQMPMVDELGYYETHAGTLYDVDSETGECSLIATVDTASGEENLGYGGRVLIFNHVQKADLRSIEVHNEHGTFTFYRANEIGEPTDDGEFIIKGSPLTDFDKDLFTSLHVSAGYTLTTYKISDPLAPSEYGLVACERQREVLDEDGEFVFDEDGNYIYEAYSYEPAYYILTEKSGTTHKLIIGDKLVTGGGYYVQYVNTDGSVRPTVYVLSEDFGTTLLAPVEDFAVAELTYPMTSTTYTNVENFYIVNRNHDSSNDALYSDPIVNFSFVPLGERQGTINENTSYFFGKEHELDGYQVSANNIDTVLQAIYEPSFGAVVKFLPTLEDFAKYGLAEATGVNDDGSIKYEIIPEHIVSFNYFELADSSSNTSALKVNNKIFISGEVDGKYYAYSYIYDVDESGKVSSEPLYETNMIVEIDAHTLEFLNWNKFDWIDDRIVSLNIAFADSITITDHQTGYNALFDFDNSSSSTTSSDSSSSDSVSSNFLTVMASDSNGNNITTFSRLILVDQSGNTWLITSSEISCVSAQGTSLTINTSYYTYNKLGKQVRANNGIIYCADGRQVRVNADTIDIGNTTISRCDTDLFRKYYQTLLYANISDTYEVSEEEHKSITKDENLIVSMTIKDTEGGVKDYKFYRLTSRKVYVTINGNGGFYMLNDRVQKLVTDAQKFFAGEIIDATSKY